jgi:hypothetical protein
MAPAGRDQGVIVWKAARQAGGDPGRVDDVGIAAVLALLAGVGSPGDGLGAGDQIVSHAHMI